MSSDHNAAQRPLEAEACCCATVEQAAVGIAHVAPDGRWVQTNRMVCDITGYSRKELLARTIQGVIHPNDRTAGLEAIRRLLGGEIPTHSMEARYIRKNGSQVWVHQAVSLVRTSAGEPDYLIFVIEDITQRILTEQALVESERLRRLMLDSIGEGVHGLDRKGRIMFENPAALKMFGWPGQEMIWQHAHTVMHHHRADGSVYPVEECPIYHTLADGRTRVVRNEVFFRRDGTSFPVEYTASALKDDFGGIVGTVVNFRDLTEQISSD